MTVKYNDFVSFDCGCLCDFPRKVFIEGCLVDAEKQETHKHTLLDMFLATRKANRL